MKAFWTDKAIERIGEIATYISRDSQSGAEKWVESIFKKVDRVAVFPKSGRKVPELPRKGIRELICGNYRIIYRLNEDGLFVLTVRHFKQVLPLEEI